MFERKFAAYIGVKHVFGVNTGTEALTLALKAVGVGHGDEVITVPNTFIATVGAIVAAGATPVFVDCDERYQIDPDRIEAAITPKNKSGLPVYWGGCPPDIEHIVAIGEEHGIPVVEDACPAVGAQINGKSAGTFGKVNAFSMHPLKPLNVWGDGGMIVTDDDRIADWLRLYRYHGMSDRDHVDIWGVNARLQPVQAIVASRLLDTIDESLATRIRNASLLDSGLRDLAACSDRAAARGPSRSLPALHRKRRTPRRAFGVPAGARGRGTGPLPDPASPPEGGRTPRLQARRFPGL